MLKCMTIYILFVKLRSSQVFYTKYDIDIRSKKSLTKQAQCGILRDDNLSSLKFLCFINPLNKNINDVCPKIEGKFDSVNHA